MNHTSEKNTKTRFILVLTALVALGVAVKYYWPTSATEAKSPVQTVTTAVVEQRDFPHVLEATGTTVAVNMVDVRPQVANVVTKIHIKDGQKVKAGDLLISLDDRVDRANYEKAQATANDLQRQLVRAEELFRQQFVAQSSVDTVRANAQAAHDAVRAAQATLSYNTIRSPLTGRAGIINVFVGSLVQPGTTVSTMTTPTGTLTQGSMVTITQLDPMNVQFTVPESAAPALFAAQKAGDVPTISFQMADGKKREGKVYVIDNQVDPTIGTLKVKAVVDNPDHTLIPGQFLRLQVQIGTFKDALIIPSQALLSSPRGDQVFVVDEQNMVSLQPVKVQAQSQGVAIITGLRVGDKVVVEGKQNLRPNAKVKEAPAKTQTKSEAKQEPKAEASK